MNNLRRKIRGDHENRTRALRYGVECFTRYATAAPHVFFRNATSSWCVLALCLLHACMCAEEKREASVRSSSSSRADSAVHPSLFTSRGVKTKEKIWYSQLAKIICAITTLYNLFYLFPSFTFLFLFLIFFIFWTQFFPPSHFLPSVCLSHGALYVGFHSQDGKIRIMGSIGRSGFGQKSLLRSISLPKRHVFLGNFCHEPVYELANQGQRLKKNKTFHKLFKK